MLPAARRPIAVIGASAMRLRDPALLRAVIERHRLPFAPSTMAKGVIDEANPLAACAADASVTIPEQVTGDLDASLAWLPRQGSAQSDWPADMAPRHREAFQ